MNSKEWEDFMADLSTCGFDDTVKTFRKLEKEVEADMAARAKNASKMITEANIIQTLYDAEKEARIVAYLDKDRKPIIH